MTPGTAPSTQLIDALEEIQRAPLDGIPADRISAVVGRVLPDQPDRQPLDVAAFSSAI